MIIITSLSTRSSRRSSWTWTLAHDPRWHRARPPHCRRLERGVSQLAFPAATRQSMIRHGLLCCPGETRSTENDIAWVRTGPFFFAWRGCSKTIRNRPSTRFSSLLVLDESRSPQKKALALTARNDSHGLDICHISDSAIRPAAGLQCPIHPFAEL